MKTDRKRLTPLHRRLVDVYLALNCHLTAAAESVGLSLTAAIAAMKRAEVKVYLEQRQAVLTEAVTVSATEVVSLLVQHMRADIADILPDEPILQEAKAAGLSANIKKIKIRQRPSKIKGRKPVCEIELEMYSAQEAAKSLAKIFGLGSQDELQRARTAIKMYCEMKDCSPETAIIALAPHVPAVIRVRDEFLRPRQLPPGE